MISLEKLDASIARFDLALSRATTHPTDPLAVHELVFCLELLDRHDLPSGLGSHVDRLIAETAELVCRFKPALPVQPHRIWAPRATETERHACEQVRSKLLELAAAISVLVRD